MMGFYSSSAPSYSPSYSYSHSCCHSSFWNPNRNRNLRMMRRRCILHSINASQSQSSGSSNEELRQGLSRSAAYSLLKQQLAVAAKFEDYKEAARLRDSLRTLEEEEPVLRLRNLLRNAVQEERYQEAAQYRDQLKELAPHALLKCSSDATTLGIRVQVRSVYVESHSRPMDGQFFYAYRIRISNNSSRAVQLLRRHWIVTDGRGRAEHVWGTGVVGQQPIIPPGAAFEYSSACPLGTPGGRMEGDFEMKPLLLPDTTDRFFASKEEDKKKKNNNNSCTGTFNVAIAPFSLSILGDNCSSSSAFL